MVPPGTGRCMSRTQAFAGMVCRKMLVRGSDIMAGKDITGIGQNVTIESAMEREHHDETHEYKSSGFTLAVKSPVIDAIQNVTNQVSAAVNSGGDARVSALRGYAAASGAVGGAGRGQRYARSRKNA
ncbi:tRNA nuclease CdiA-2 [Pandoraea communis]|uniref:tRNA nuclease CdiA-2 n=2 Tax=Pandoraea communis TaxID=2508297 RepID=A0A5E4Z6S3_9BURK|nr:tRNA nuclease CdiA-2 [Pandoraea communis]